MASPSNTVKPAETEKLVNTDIDVIAEELGTLCFDGSGSPNSLGIFDWDMVDLVDNLKGFKLHEGDSSKPKPTQEPDWLVVNLDNVPKNATEVGQPQVIPEQPYMAHSKAMNIASVTDHFEVDARRVQAAVLLEGQAARNLSNGKKGRHHRKKKKNKEETKFFPHAPHHFFKQNKEHIICYVCGQPGHTARVCKHRKGRGGSGQSKMAHERLVDSSSSGGVSWWAD